jgi:hypothetical protein
MENAYGHLRKCREIQNKIHIPDETNSQYGQCHLCVVSCFEETQKPTDTEISLYASMLYAFRNFDMYLLCKFARWVKVNNVIVSAMKY